MSTQHVSTPPPKGQAGAHDADRAAAAATRVRERALALGFDAVGFARADEPLDDDFARYQSFVDAGMHGQMGWLAADAQARRRLDTADILEGARSVVCVAMRYGRSLDSEAADPPLARSIARYARGRDYHNGLRKKLRKLAAFVRALGTADEPVRARPICDTAPVLERAWAARAGLGFIGKNGLLIVPGVGSLVLLGEVVTTLALPAATPIAERCGTCTRCLDACPTQAFVRPFVLDARKCVSYLTIEHRGAIDADLRGPIGARLFGCDDCQTVCPFNASTAQGRAPDPSDRFAPHPSWTSGGPADLLSLAEPAWARLVEGSPVHRATREGLARNAAIVIGNSSRDRTLVERAAREHPSEIVRDAAVWAVARIDARGGDGSA